MINDAYSIIESATLFLNTYIYGPLIEYMYQILIAIGVAVLIKILKYSRECHTARKARKNFFFLDGKKYFLYWNTLKHGKRGHGTICFTSNILGGFDVKIYEELFKMECSYSAKISIDARILYVDMKRE